MTKKPALAAITLLSAIRDERSFHPIVLLVTDRNEGIWLTAAEVLSLGDIRAVEPLTQACADENGFMRVMAREAITNVLCRQPEPSYPRKVSRSPVYCCLDYL